MSSEAPELSIIEALVFVDFQECIVSHPVHPLKYVIITVKGRHLN